MKTNWILFVLILCSAQGIAQRKSIGISRIDTLVEVDGALTEPFWEEAEIAMNFRQNQPVAGDPASSPTFVKLAYDDAALYIGAEMLDDRDSMSLTLSQRDDFGNADWFGVVIDPYDAGTIGFAFLVTSAGVQVDELHQVDDVDNNWNAVWKSEVVVSADRWTAEMRIPFSALRFPKKAIQTWGITFARNIRRNREQSYWNFYDPKGINLISQLGQLKGIEQIESPLRLSFVPYVSGYVEHFDDNVGSSLNGGMDVKYGLNDAFTLDMTLIPDFGQVQFDQQVLNLSPFEVQFNENRQFFTEGTELFNKQGLFYSRRVGATPIGFITSRDLDSNETVITNPTNTQLYNASKLSGRTKKGTGIGVFNAVTAEMTGEIRDTITGESRFVQTAPLSNYSVFVIDQNLKNNSSITLTNTNVLRSGEIYDANVTALGTNLYSKGQQYNTGGSVVVSQRYVADTADLGYNYAARVGKSAGNFLWQLSYSESNERFNKNDLGFQLNNNIRAMGARLNYNIYEPFGRFYRVWTTANFSYERLVNPNEFAQFLINLNANGTFLNFMTSGVWAESSPIKNKNWFEPRVKGRFYEEDEYLALGGFISSDYSKPFALDVNAGYYMFNETNRFNYELRISPRFRFSDQFLMVYNYTMDVAKNDEGAALTRFFRVPLENGDPIFAKRDRLTVVNSISADYIFTNRMGIVFSLRHYWSKVGYNAFFRLDENGQFAPTAYTGFDVTENSMHNNSFNAFTIDMVYRWVFAPGSELRFVWKNSIFSSSGDATTTYFENIEELANFPATNSLSLKILYYIDYGALHSQWKAN